VPPFHPSPVETVSSLGRKGDLSKRSPSDRRGEHRPATFQTFRHVSANFSAVRGGRGGEGGGGNAEVDGPVQTRRRV